jgi:hypothetical protein
LAVAEPLLERNFHPTVIVRGYMRALQTALDTCNQISRTIDVNNTTEMREIVTSVRVMSHVLLSCTAVWWVYKRFVFDRTCAAECVASLAAVFRKRFILTEPACAENYVHCCTV